MIAWVALVLALLNLVIWVGLAVVARRLYRQAAPMLSMLGLGSSVAVPAGTETAAAAAPSSPAGIVPRCPHWPAPPNGRQGQCIWELGHNGNHQWEPLQA